MAEERLNRTVLLEETMPFSVNAEALDLRELRVAFSALFDQTAKQVFLAGLDLDDVVLERLIDCRFGDGTTVRVSMPSLTDREAVLNAVREAGSGAGDDPRRRLTVEVCAILARVIREEPGR